MKNNLLSCVLLSTDLRDKHIVDDDLAYPAMQARGLSPRRVSWHANDFDWSAADLIVVRTTWDYHTDVDSFFRTLERIAATGVPLANPLEIMRWNARKTYLSDLEKAGVPIVPTQFGEALDSDKLDSLVDTYADVPWVLKPDIGANSGGVFRLHGVPDSATREALLIHFEDMGYLAQRFVNSVTATGEYSVFFFDGRYSHSILKTPQDGDFRVQEDYGAHIRAIVPSATLRAAADAVIAALPAECLIVRVDLVANDSEVFQVMEVELIEPSLYLRTAPESPEQFAHAVRRWYDRHA